MRAGWDRHRLGSISEINYGYTESATDAPVGPRFLRITDLQEGSVDWETVPHCPIDAVALPRYLLRHGDIVFARTGATTGKSFLVRHPPMAVPASYLIRLRLLGGEVLPEFVSFFFQSPSYWAEIAAGSTGSAQGGFNASKLGELMVPTPILPEQKRIVAILDEAFAAIATAKANTERNLANAREIFEGHLQTVFSELAQDGPLLSLDQVALDFGRGKSKHRPRNDPSLYDGEYPFVQTGDVRNAIHEITEYEQTYNERGLAQSKLWPAGTVCITIAANIAEAAILAFPACFPDSVVGIVVDKSRASSGYVLYLLRESRAALQALGKGSAQANINLATFEGMLFPFPSVTKQRAVVTHLDALQRETRRLESIYTQKLAALDALKKSLLHEAFSGNL